MRSRLFIGLWFLFLVSAAEPGHAQGCSDAGVCTMGAMGQQQVLADTSLAEQRHELKTSFSFGRGEQHVSVFQLTPELNLGISPEWRLQAKLPFTFVSGNLGRNSGAGDASFSLTYRRKTARGAVLGFTGGVKIATGDASATAGGLALPMPYQTSLGTHDVVAGFSFGWKGWNFAAAYQHVIVHHNQNGFLHKAWPAGSPAQQYFESDHLRRGNDALIRAEKKFVSGRFSVNPGLLALYRLQEDRTGENMPVAGSKGFTLNITASAEYVRKGPWIFGLLFAAPAVVRENRPDGLTRAVVAGFSTAYHFGKFKNSQS